MALIIIQFKLDITNVFLVTWLVSSLRLSIILENETLDLAFMLLVLPSVGICRGWGLPAHRRFQDKIALSGRPTTAHLLFCQWWTFHKRSIIVPTRRIMALFSYFSWRFILKNVQVFFYFLGDFVSTYASPHFARNTNIGQLSYAF